MFISALLAYILGAFTGAGLWEWIQGLLPAVGA